MTKEELKDLETSSFFFFIFAKNMHYYETDLGV